MKEGQKNTEAAGMSRRELIKGALTVGVASAGVGTAKATAGSGHSQNEPSNRAFTGKTAFITGGARGIGFATVESLEKIPLK